jgi:hypothetical protein
VDYYAGSRQVTEWLRAGLQKMGAKPETIPPDADL